MRRLVRSVLLAAAILVTGCLAAACVQTASGAVTSSPPTASAPATETAPPSPTPAPPTPSPASPTVAPSTPPSVTPASTPAPSSGFSFNLIWLWIILGAVVLVLIIVLATRSPGRSDQAVLWRSRTAHTYEQGGAFDSAVREGEHQGAYLDRDGTAWHHIQHRAHDLTEALYILREEALTAGQRAQVEDALAALQAVRYALDDEVAPGAQQSGTLDSRLRALESSLNALRVTDNPLG